MSLREKVIVAAAVAPQRSLEGILPLLAGDDIAIERVSIPSTLAGRALTHPDLAFIRHELDLSVLAIQTPGEDRWRAGGQISDQALPEGTSLLVAGSKDSLRRFEERVGVSSTG